MTWQFFEISYLMIFANTKTVVPFADVWCFGDYRSSPTLPQKMTPNFVRLRTPRGKSDNDSCHSPTPMKTQLVTKDVPAVYTPLPTASGCICLFYIVVCGEFTLPCLQGLLRVKIQSLFMTFRREFSWTMSITNNILSLTRYACPPRSNCPSPFSLTLPSCSTVILLVLWSSSCI